MDFFLRMTIFFKMSIFEISNLKKQFKQITSHWQKNNFEKKKRTWKKKVGNFGARCPEGENSSAGGPQI